MKNQTIEQFADNALAIAKHEARHAKAARGVGLSADTTLFLDAAGNAIDGLVEARGEVSAFKHGVVSLAGLMGEPYLPRPTWDTLPEWVEAVKGCREHISDLDWEGIQRCPAHHLVIAARWAFKLLEDHRHEIWEEAKELAHQAHIQRAELLSGNTPGQQTKGNMNIDELDRLLGGNKQEVAREVTDQQFALLGDMCRGMSSAQLASLQASGADLYKLLGPMPERQQLQARTFSEADPWNLLPVESRKPKISFQLAMGRPGKLTVFKDGFQVTNPDRALELVTAS